MVFLATSMDEKIIKFLKKRHILSLSVACDASLLDFSDPAFSIAGLSDLGTDDTAATNATNAANAENAENAALFSYFSHIITV